MSEQEYILSKRDFSSKRAAKPSRFSFTGVTLRVGPSRLQPEVEIATIAIFNSSNDKTGNVVQVYYLPTAEHPLDAVKTGLDAAVCGDCPLRPVHSNVCYVRKFHGPAKVWSTFQNGRYPLFKDLSADQRHKVVEILQSKPIRLGAYGDPACDLFSSRFLADLARGKITSYTHQWRNTPELMGYSMASVDSTEEYIQAKGLGWRTYRHTSDNTAFTNETICPHKSYAIQCIDCGLCGGLASNSSKDIVTKTL